MRSSYIQPSGHNPQQASSDEKRKEESTTNKREERNSAEQRKEAPETKKLERKTTEDINASAEAFIKNFRQQLLIQRLQSIENYEQMLARGLQQTSHIQISLNVRAQLYIKYISLCMYHFYILFDLLFLFSALQCTSMVQRDKRDKVQNNYSVPARMEHKRIVNLD